MRFRHLIVDRDGVINQELADGWIDSIDDWVWVPGSLDALVAAQRAGVTVSVATNQSGIGRGHVTQTAVVELHHQVDGQLAAAGGLPLAWFVCPHSPAVSCACRKPAPGLLLDAMQAAGILPKLTVMVGDSPRDVDAAAAAGVVSALVRTGKGEMSIGELALRPTGAGVELCQDLAGFVGALLTEH